MNFHLNSITDYFHKEQRSYNVVRTGKSFWKVRCFNAIWSQTAVSLTRPLIDFWTSTYLTRARANWNGQISPRNCETEVKQLPTVAINKNYQVRVLAAQPTWRCTAVTCNIRQLYPTIKNTWPPHTQNDTQSHVLISQFYETWRNYHESHRFIVTSSGF